MFSNLKVTVYTSIVLGTQKGRHVLDCLLHYNKSKLPVSKQLVNGLSVSWMNDNLPNMIVTLTLCGKDKTSWSLLLLYPSHMQNVLCQLIKIAGVDGVGAEQGKCWPRSCRVGERAEVMPVMGAVIIMYLLF